MEANMGTPLSVALDIERLIADARRRDQPLDISACASELYLRFLASGCSRGQIAEALVHEAEAAGVTLH
jgi:hypothetical protein